MSLFNFGKKKVEPAGEPIKKEPIIIWSKEFKQAGSFKGFRRIRLTIYKEDGVDDTLLYFKERNNDFKGRTIRLDHVRIPGTVHEDVDFVNVYADNMRIGAIYSSNEMSYKLLTENEYDKAHIRVEDGDVYLFVHITA